MMDAVTAVTFADVNARLEAAHPPPVAELIGEVHCNAGESKQI